MEPIPTPLQERVAFFKTLAYAPNTNRAYSVHRRAYVAFCNNLGVNPVPATSGVLCAYAAHLAERLCFSSIKQYLNIIRILHQEWGFANPCPDDYNLKLTLRGIRRHLGDPVHRKEPITPALLLTLLASLDVNTPKDAAIWAACLVMFFGLLRRSNVVPPTSKDFDPGKHLRRGDVTFSPLGASVCIRWSKTTQFREKIRQIPLPWRKLHPLCPTQAVFNAYQLSEGAAATGPAFVFREGGSFKALTPDHIITSLRKALEGAGLSPKQYAGHSFRRGGATWAFECNVPIESIRQLGDWASTAYTKYVLPTEGSLRGATSLMANHLPSP